MSGKGSAAIAARNEEIRLRLANGEKAKKLAPEYGVRTTTIYAIAKKYKGSGYEAVEPVQRGHDYETVDMTKVDRTVQESMLDVHITSLDVRAHSLKQKRETWRQLLDNIYQIYSGSMPGSAAAELALAELISIAIKLQGVETRIIAQAGARAVLQMAMNSQGGDSNDTK